VRLAGSAVQVLTAALMDGFSNQGEFEDLAICMDKRLGDISDANAKNPDLVRALIECAEKEDAVDRLVDCAQRQRDGNRLITALDASNLAVAAEPRQVVEGSAGTTVFKDQLIAALGHVGSLGLEAVAAKELATMLREADDADAETLLLGLVGTLRVSTSREGAAALTPVLAAALRRRHGPKSRPAGVDVDLARVRMDRIDLSGLDLHEADLAFASLRHAELARTNLWRSRAYAVDVSKAHLSGSNLEEARWHEAKATEVRFHECRMVSVFLKDADLAGAQFQRARLQGAHFERTDLTGASFEQAKLADAYFTGATIDDAAAASIARADGWERARLDPDARSRVERASG
jgi:uncharacterized protein YjbI with pentapeptide repeats